MIDVSIIIPVYFNEENIVQTINTIKNEVIEKNVERQFEVIFVDDGSRDRSFSILEQVYDKNKGLIKVIKFSRNFGQVNAMFAGYEKSRGKCVINISADMQDPPELMNEMISAFFDDNIGIVIGTRIDRDESLFRKKSSNFFYKLIQKLSFPNMPIGGFDYALLGRNVVEIMLRNQEANLFWQGQILWTGFPVKFISYKRRAREFGTSKWTFGKKIKYLIDGVMAYSFVPLRFMAVFGVALFIIGIVYTFVILGTYFLGNVPFKGWAPIMILMLILFGIVFLMLGIIGEYLWRVLDQTRGRSNYLIDKELD